MADFCRDCTVSVFGPDVPEGAHDMADYTAWDLCEGCGFHVFANGARLCRRGPWPATHATAEPCPQCLALLVGPKPPAA